MKIAGYRNEAKFGSFSENVDQHFLERKLYLKFSRS